MRFSLFLFIYALSAPAFASSIEQRHVESLTRARSAGEIRRLTEEFEEFKVARDACRLQLRKKQAPLACYESLELEVRRGLHPNPRGRKALIARLDALCDASAQMLNVPRARASRPGVSRRCVESLRSAREIQIYRDRRPELGPEID